MPPRIASMSSIGNSIIVFWLGSVEIRSKVFNVRRLIAPWVFARISAAWANVSAAAFSPSALMILARRSRSASACLAMARFMSPGSSIF